MIYYRWRTACLLSIFDSYSRKLYHFIIHTLWVVNSMPNTRHNQPPYSLYLTDRGPCVPAAGTSLEGCIIHHMYILDKTQPTPLLSTFDRSRTLCPRCCVDLTDEQQRVEGGVLTDRGPYWWAAESRGGVVPDRGPYVRAAGTLLLTVWSSRE
jgi:hypothetical protein